MNKLAPPSHINGQMASDAPDDVKLERAQWIMAQFDANFTAAQIGATLQISAVRVRHATNGFREFGKLNRRAVDIALHRADWETIDIGQRHETDPRFTLVRPPRNGTQIPSPQRPSGLCAQSMPISWPNAVTKPRVTRPSGPASSNKGRESK